MVTEHVAPCLTKELNRVSQLISIKDKMLQALVKLCLEPKIPKCSPSWICSVFSYALEQLSDIILSEKKRISCITASQKLAMSATR